MTEWIRFLRRCPYSQPGTPPEGVEHALSVSLSDDTQDPNLIPLRERIPALAPFTGDNSVLECGAKTTAHPSFSSTAPPAANQASKPPRRA